MLQDHMRLSCWVIHITSYICPKGDIIGEVVQKPVTVAYCLGCPYRSAFLPTSKCLNQQMKLLFFSEWSQGREPRARRR